MMTILNNLLSFIKAKPRLFIEYLMIGAVVFLCGVSSYLWLQNEVSQSRLDATASKLETSDKRLGSVEGENKKLGEAVVFLANQRIKDSESFSRLTNTLDVQQAQQKLLQDKMSNLEETNATVKAYLDERVPDDLRRLLEQDSSTTGTVNTDSEGKTSRPLDNRVQGG